MRMQTVTSKPRIFKAEFNLNKRFFQTSNSQQVALDNHLFQWSRRHASYFNTGSVTFVGTREPGIWWWDLLRICSL